MTRKVLVPKRKGNERRDNGGRDDLVRRLAASASQGYDDCDRFGDTTSQAGEPEGAQLATSAPSSSFENVCF